MNKSQIAEFIRSSYKECEIKEGRQFTEVLVPPSDFHSLAQFLRENNESWFDFLVSVNGIDYGAELGVNYHLRSTRFNHDIILKVKTHDREDPHFDSVADIWQAADFLEREVYDLLGIKFSGHPDLRRLFLDNTWGFPLRKDYTDEVNIVTK